MHRFERCQSTESIWEEPERGTFFRTTLRSTQQPMRRISWAASLCLPLPVDNKLKLNQTSCPQSLLVGTTFLGTLILTLMTGCSRKTVRGSLASGVRVTLLSEVIHKYWRVHMWRNRTCCSHLMTSPRIIKIGHFSTEMPCSPFSSIYFVQPGCPKFCAYCNKSYSISLSASLLQFIIFTIPPLRIL